MKKAVAIVDLENGKNKQFIDELVKTMHGMKAIVDDMLLNSTTVDTIKEVFRLNDAGLEVEKFNPPIVIEEAHVRHFFSKMQKGQFAVQRYRGYTIDSPTELINFFTVSVGKRAFGENWLEKDFLEVYEGYPQGVYTISDCNYLQSCQLSMLLGNDLATVLIGSQEGPESYEVHESDIYIQTDSKLNKKKVNEATETILKTLKTVWKDKKDDSNKPTTTSVVRSRFNEAGARAEQDSVREDSEGRG